MPFNPRRSDTLSGDWASNGGNGWARQGVQLIDFARSIDLNAYPAGARFTGTCHDRAPQCMQMRAGLPWLYDVRACLAPTRV